MASHPVYHDHSHMDDKWITEHVHSAKGGNAESFPRKLHCMLESVASAGHASIVRWLPHGRAFKVYDKKRFEAEVLPKYFQNQGGFLSFQRQLNLYGFLRLTGRGRDQNAYYHELLLRGRPKLCSLIHRKSASSCSVRRTFDPATEPDFYGMVPLPENDVKQNNMFSRYVNQALEKGTGTMITTYGQLDALTDTREAKRSKLAMHATQEDNTANCSLFDASSLMKTALLEIPSSEFKVDISFTQRDRTKRKLASLTDYFDCVDAYRDGVYRSLPNLLMALRHCEADREAANEKRIPADRHDVPELVVESLEEIRYDLCPEYNNGVDTFDWMNTIDVEAFW